MSKLRLGELFAILTIIVLVVPSANAYVDPGSGSLILQSVMAVVAGFIIFSNSWIAFFKERFFRRKKTSDHASKNQSGNIER